MSIEVNDIVRNPTWGNGRVIANRLTRNGCEGEWFVVEFFKDGHMIELHESRLTLEAKAADVGALNHTDPRAVGYLNSLVAYWASVAYNNGATRDMVEAFAENAEQISDENTTADGWLENFQASMSEYL